MTAEELLYYSNEPLRQELIAGRLYEMEPTGMEHGAVAAKVVTMLQIHVRAHDLGVVFATEAGYHLESDPDTVRAPDVSFITRERIAIEGIPRGFWRGAPDLAFEVNSPSSRPTPVAEKAADWIAAGTRVVVVLEPRRRTATVHRRDAEPVVVGAEAPLDLGDVVPGFAPTVADLFV